MSLNVITFFCEDIREEKSNTETLVGVMPSTLSIPSFPSGIPKLGIYCRLQFPMTLADFSAEAFLQTSWGQSVPIGGFSGDLTAQAKKESLAQGLPLASIILKAMIVPMPLPEPGRIDFILKMGEEERICGVLGLFAIRPNASEPPSLRSPPGRAAHS